MKESTVKYGKKKKKKKRLRNDNGEPQCQAKEVRLDFVVLACVE